VKRATLHRAGALAGLLAGPFFLISVGLNTWASLVTLIDLAGIRRRRASSVAELAGTWAARVGADCNLHYHWPADRRPRRRDTRSTAAEAATGSAVMLLALLGVALILAAFRVDVPMLSGGNPGWVPGIAFLLIIATGMLAPLTMALAVRRDPSWRPIMIISA
jgi:hypothetical protein